MLEKLGVIAERLDNVQKKLGDIYLQVTLTNGRVNSLESWRDRIVGGLTVLILLVIPVVVKIVGEWLHLP